MAETSALNPVEHVKDEVGPVKMEMEVTVKPEPLECAVCVERSPECVDIGVTRTLSGTLLIDFLSKFTHTDLVGTSSKHICKSCHHLINILEQAELEYIKLKEAFETVISKNPLFDHSQQTVMPVKVEYGGHVNNEPLKASDSEDEPLAITKKKRRKPVKNKKKVVPAPKRKPRAKKESHNTVNKQNVVIKNVKREAGPNDVKKEDAIDRSESTEVNNGLNTCKLEIDYFDDDDDDDDDFDDDEDSNFMPDEVSNGDKPTNLLIERVKRGRRRRLDKGDKKKQAIHQCDQCDAKYTTFKRLELHKEKHSEGKPPYICEVCGAHYKHKRACDIHVGLHKGISDWKCEECNKLFPSKGALQRHNNIHTGKLNYQCDLCGKSFIHTSSFKMHKLSHSGVKPHACDVCGLALMTRSHLKRHKRVHSGEKRHECNVCGKRFSERYNLVAHAKSHEGAGEAVLPTVPRRRLFRCPYCQERFERRYMLERHVSLSHGRTLERAPATPRNTMSKLLKAQAQARAQPHAQHELTDTKEERSPDSRSSSIGPQKMQLASSMPALSASSWSGAYAAEFGLRSEYSQ